MPSIERPSPLILSESELTVILRMRQLTHGSVVIKIQDGVPVFLQKVEDFKLV